MSDRAHGRLILFQAGLVILISSFALSFQAAFGVFKVKVAITFYFVELAPVTAMVVGKTFENFGTRSGARIGEGAVLEPYLNCL